MRQIQILAAAAVAAVGGLGALAVGFRRYRENAAEGGGIFGVKRIAPRNVKKVSKSAKAKTKSAAPKNVRVAVPALAVSEPQPNEHYLGDGPEVTLEQLEDAALQQLSQETQPRHPPRMRFSDKSAKAA